MNFTARQFTAKPGPKDQDAAVVARNPSPDRHITGAFTARGKALASSSSITIALENNDNKSALPGSVDILSSGFAYPRTFARSYARPQDKKDRERALRLAYFNEMSDTADE